MKKRNTGVLFRCKENNSIWMYKRQEEKTMSKGKCVHNILDTGHTKL